VSIPEPELVSLQVKLIVTSELFHPFVLGDGETAYVMVGGVLSILRASVPAVQLPAGSQLGVLM